MPSAWHEISRNMRTGERSVQWSLLFFSIEVQPFPMRQVECCGQPARLHTQSVEGTERDAVLRNMPSAIMHFTTYVPGKCPAGCIIPEPGCPGQSETMLLRGGCVRPYVSA